jgi:sulfate permease, SulP family
MAAGLGLVDARGIRTLFTLSPRSGVLALVTASCVVIVGVIPGMLVGVLLSLVGLIARVSNPRGTVLGFRSDTGRYHDLGEAAPRETVPGLVAFRLYGPLLFCNADSVRRQVEDVLAGATQPVRVFIFDMQAVTTLDVTAADVLGALIARFQEEGVVFQLARVNRPLRETLTRLGFNRLLEAGAFLPSVHAGVEAFLASGKQEGVRESEAPSRS